MNLRFQSNKRKRGFTLVEILVSISVLGLIMVGVAQMMNSALNVTVIGYKHMDADTQARMVLDRIAFDISKMTKRTDVDYYFGKNNGSGASGANDQMAFYSESGGYYPGTVTPATQGSNVSLVGYKVNSTTNQLQRLSKGLSWNGSVSNLPSMVFNPLPATGFTCVGNTASNTLLSTAWNGASNQIVNGNDQDYQVIGDQVFRLEYTFLVQTSAATSANNAAVYSSQSAAQQGLYDQTGTYLYDYPWMPYNYVNNTASQVSSPQGMRDVTAVIISIAVLDTKSRASISSAALTTAASYLLDAGGTTHSYGSSLGPAAAASTSLANLPVTLWKAKLLSATAPKYLGLPKSVAAQVRFYQRYCYLNHLQ